MDPSANLQSFYQSVRRQTLRLTENLAPEDMVVQSMPDASPSKWHLAHTSWFFEEFLLQPHLPNYRCFDDSFRFLFNSYYEMVGERHPRPQRGLLTRPSLSAVLHYRHYVDSHMQDLLGNAPQPIAELVITGLHHEMQHQELLLTDILHLLSFNPLSPSINKHERQPTVTRGPLQMHAFSGGLVELGAESEGFSYDCERPRHQVFLQAFKLAQRPVSNGEWLDFIDDGGYRNPLLWLADGWDICQQQQWRAPLYWREVDGVWHQYGLDGLQQLNFAAPVCHISYYEADAFARWAGKRLPREQEWEHGAAELPIEGNFLEQSVWRPQVVSGDAKLQQMYGDVWEWTSSPYMAYPGFKPEGGALQEYNGKFMANQFVLRGGSCVTPRFQMRASYRNFFHPHQRWQFTGLRLAEDD